GSGRAGRGGSVLRGPRLRGRGRGVRGRWHPAPAHASEARVMEGPLRVGIVGARGIGKHHAKWFALAGCELAAIYGTTPESAERAAAAVRELAPFPGRVFSDWEQFVAEGNFQAASVCSPADAHHRNVLDLLRAGRHVLCEKPLVW